MKRRIRWELLVFDSLVYLIIAHYILILYPSSIIRLTMQQSLWYILLGWVCITASRIATHIYRKIWRYAGPMDYMVLISADGLATLAVLLLRILLPGALTMVRAVSLFTVNLLGCIMIRLMYQWIYQRRSNHGKIERAALWLLKWTTGVSFAGENMSANRIRIAVIGAGSVGAMLADELLQNPKATYEPVCFVDIDAEKVGREVYGVPVLDNGPTLGDSLRAMNVQEVVFALPNMKTERREELYNRYRDLGYKIKAYDYPMLGEGKRMLHDFDIGDLLFRSPAEFLSEKTIAWYKGRKVLITGGGGSIGSELARQIARCGPAALTILDVCENGAYEIQQELLRRHGRDFPVQVEIVSVCDRAKLEKVLDAARPDIVLHAAAHKHVPLMEHNVCEAVDNNVFGTLNVVELCERFGVSRFIMVSTDKAVNPTNVMGASKRLCEMIVQSFDQMIRSGRASEIPPLYTHVGEAAAAPDAAVFGEVRTEFVAVRFGNVLGSNGSVIPVFKRQIAKGGPVTVTHPDIIRYFMTIPEAVSLVLQAGTYAQGGEIFVLDMGSPVRIDDLARNLIKLSGFKPDVDIPIVYTGLRPGEKLYEEKLMSEEGLRTTANEKIHIGCPIPFDADAFLAGLAPLMEAAYDNRETEIRSMVEALVPTYQPVGKQPAPVA